MKERRVNSGIAAGSGVEAVMSAREQEREAIRAEFLNEARRAFQRMFEGEGSGPRTFDELEACVLEEVRRLGNWSLQRRVDGQTLAADSEPEACCPKCGQAANLVEMKELPARTVKTHLGEVGLKRREYSCRQCRRSFFPGGPCA